MGTRREFGMIQPLVSGDLPSKGLDGVQHLYIQALPIGFHCFNCSKSVFLFAFCQLVWCYLDFFSIVTNLEVTNVDFHQGSVSLDLMDFPDFPPVGLLDSQ